MGKANAKELNFWTKNEYDIFIQSFGEKEEMYRMIYQMLFWLVCRVGELLALCYGDLDFQNGTVSITNRAMQKKMKQKVDKLGLGYLDVSTTRNV